jgi:S-formylglutathione hydrolase FrmB
MTPFRAMLVYGLAFLLVAWHQSGRVAEWFENQALEREGRLFENVLALAGFLKEKVWPHGPAQFNSLEDKILAWLSPEAEIGAVRPPTPPPPPGPDLPGEEEPEAAEAEITAPTRAGPVWPDPEAAPDLWLSQVNPDEHLPVVIPEISVLAPEPPPPPPEPETDSARPAARRVGKVLLLGDSMMLEGLGPQLQKELRRRYENLTVERDGRYGTGLTRLDYFDWLDFFDRMLVKYSPELVILTVGANDPQDILDPEGPPGRRRIFVGTAGWNEVYAARVAKLLKLAEDRGVRVFWVGLPIMGREPYGGRVANINAVAAAACAGAPNCRFWDSWLSVADARGRFISYALDEKGRRLRLRGRDSIHLTEEGGRIMAHKFLAETEGWADYRAGEPAEPPAAESEQLQADQQGTARPPAEPQAAPLTRLGVPPLPPQRPRPESGPEPAAPAALPAEPQEVRLPGPVPPEPEAPEEDEFVDPLPVESSPLRPAPSTGDGSATESLPLDGSSADPEFLPLDGPSVEPASLRSAPSTGGAATESLPLDGPSAEPEFLPLDDSSVEPASLRSAPSADGAAVWSEGLFYSPALGRETVLRLAEPRPGPGRPGPFPVILLLHGAWDSASAWERELGREALLALADRLAIILALPEGGSFGWYLDGPEAAMETFLLADFLPALLKKPAVDKSRLAVAGLSMGGHGALTLALKRPDLFQAAAALSAVTDLAAHAGDAHKVDPELAIDRVLGPAGLKGRNWRAFGAAGLWEARADAWRGRPLFLGVGEGDGLTLAENRAFTRQLARLGIDHVYQEKPGGHDWGYWSAELPSLLAFLSEALEPLGP